MSAGPMGLQHELHASRVAPHLIGGDPALVMPPGMDAELPRITRETQAETEQFYASEKKNLVCFK